MGYDPAADFKLKALPNIGDRELLEETFGVECFDSYGFHEVQWVAVECPAHDGLHIFEDAFIVQIVDPETGEPLPDGELGSICITELYKTGSPQFRYNIMDLSYLYPPGQCACGSWLRKMAPFAGRGDNMVKLRGVNVWPEAVGELALAVDGVDYRLVRAGGAATATATSWSSRWSASATRPPSRRSPPRSRRGSRTASACASRSRSSRRARSTRGPRSTCPPS